MMCRTGKSASATCGTATLGCLRVPGAMVMAFASIFVPNFMVQALVRAEPVLRDRALVLMEGAGSACSVVALNAAAAKWGAQIGMTKSQAQQFGEIEVRECSPAQEKISHAALLDLGWSVSPRVEDTAPDTMIVDIAGLACLFGSEEAIARKLAEGATHLGLTAQVATASNVHTALLASRAFAGITIIPAGEEAATLGKVPVAALSPSQEILETLERWGVRTCAALAALPVLQLSERLGQEGIRLQQLAQACSRRALVLAKPALQFEEQLELEHAEAELEPLAFLLGRLLDALCARLAERALAAGVLRVRFELEPACDNMVIPLKADNFRACPQPGVYERTFCLAVPMGNSKMLLKLLSLNLQADPPSAPVRKILLAAEAARPRVAQGGLFSPISPDPEKMELTVARLTKLVGAAKIGSPQLLDTHRPAGFRMRRFVPSENRDAKECASPQQFTVARRKTENDTVLKGGGSFAKACQTALRVFRPPLPASVELRRGCPAWVAFKGVRGRVIAVSGPWRCSGDWWSNDAWESDEWDVEMQFRSPAGSRLEQPGAGTQAKSQRGLYRLFYDLARREWFVRGAYD